MLEKAQPFKRKERPMRGSHMVWTVVGVLAAVALLMVIL